MVSLACLSVGVVLKIPLLGCFIWPLAVAGLGFNNFATNVLLMFGHPLRKPSSMLSSGWRFLGCTEIGGQTLLHWHRF